MTRRIEIPVHYDLWMRGARTGTVVDQRKGRPGKSAYLLVEMDHPQVRKAIKVWEPDWDYIKELS